MTEPFCREDGEDDEQRQHDELRDQKWRLRLLGSERVQRRHLEERLHDAYEHVEVEGEGGADDVDRAPCAPQAQTVASEETEPGDIGGHRGDEEERGPPAAVSSTQQAA